MPKRVGEDESSTAERDSSAPHLQLKGRRKTKKHVLKMGPVQRDIISSLDGPQGGSKKGGWRTRFVYHKRL